MSYVHSISVILLQNDQNGEQIQKNQPFFFVLFLLLFYRMQICRIFTESTQTTKGKNVCDVIFG